ncbi:alanine racemase [Dielma fastidiosa]|uniref:Alanine racemase n=1 Tax=Dielma fastidiosa TaxID=1034346 RepID=A0A318KP81_9FIRM|nr:alanine racemase [Dielma fastidiosa]PXX77545.1 serine/alanine racemase [Dielma fastidiosa]
MLQSKSRAWLQVDGDAVRHNLKEIKNLIPETTEIMAVVKANCYGHGDRQLSMLMQQEGIKTFAVSSVDEALNLREAGISGEILILGYTPKEHFHYLHEKQLLQNFLSLDYASQLDEYASLHHVVIRGHIKIDTGMARLGIRCLDDDYNIQEVFEIYKLQHLSVEGLFSHFSVADSLDIEDDRAYTIHQRELFDQVIADVLQAGLNPGKLHLQNSYGVLNYPELCYDYVRPGILMLGFTSDDSISINTSPEFIPAMSLYAEVSRVRLVKKGCSVGYGRHYKAKEDRLIATVSIGYADGIPRAASNQGMQVLLHSQRAEIVGNICMDQLMIDVTGIEHVKSGDIVTLIGQDGNERVTIDEWSRCVHTINNDLVCQISARVPRFYEHF